nr:hypothetical protein [uncultured Bacteroides sp.]
MSKFALEKIELIKGRQTFNKLLVDGKAPFDSFTEELEEQYESELGSIYYRMEAVANLQSLPKDKFRELKGGKGDVKEYEFKSKHLRVYAIHQKDGKIVVMGGYKNSQDKDITTFRALKKQYIDSLNTKEI